MGSNRTIFDLQVRSIISDFAVTIGIIIMVGVDMAMKLDTTKLYVPDKFQVSVIFSTARRFISREQRFF